MYQLNSTRLILERARLLLREREDLSARVLLGGVGEISAGIAVLEASSAPTPEVAPLPGRRNCGPQPAPEPAYASHPSASYAI